MKKGCKGYNQPETRRDLEVLGRCAADAPRLSAVAVVPSAACSEDRDPCESPPPRHRCSRCHNFAAKDLTAAQTTDLSNARPVL